MIPQKHIDYVSNYLVNPLIDTDISVTIPDFLEMYEQSEKDFGLLFKDSWINAFQCKFQSFKRDGTVPPILWNPCNSEIYSMMLKEGIASMVTYERRENLELKRSVDFYVSNVLTERIIGSLEVALGSDFVDREIGFMYGEEFCFSEELISMKSELDLKPTLWIATNFDHPEFTSLFQKSLDCKYLDKVIVFDVTRYAFTLNEEHLKNNNLLCQLGFRRV